MGINTVHIYVTYITKIHFNIIHCLDFLLRFTKRKSFSFRLAICAAHLIILRLFIAIKYSNFRVIYFPIFSFYDLPLRKFYRNNFIP